MRKKLFYASILLLVTGIAMTATPFFLTYRAISMSTMTPAPEALARGVSNAIPWVFAGLAISVLGILTRILVFFIPKS